jgi:phenylalanyl-tRNA synthetase beta chain
MIFSYNWLQSFFKKKLPRSEKLAELLTLHFADVEEVKKEGKDFTLDVDVRPNRAGDCFSHLGIAREIAVITDSKLQLPDSGLKEDKSLKVNNFVQVLVKHKWACPRYTARVIVDVKVGSSPEWLKARLISCGLRPISNIVDIANYVMLETGQPLHAFDGEKLEGRKIIVRFAGDGEKITTLDGQKFNLDSDILVIADGKKPVGIAGIKGGKIPEIDRETKVVVLESANFNPQIIRRSSRKLKLRTDASLRFEHGIDPNLTKEAINRAAFLVQKLAGGKVATGLIDVYPQKTRPKIIKLDLNYVKSLLGIEIPRVRVADILKKLGFEIRRQAANVITVRVPLFRLDVSIQEDLIEEVGRIYGYDKIPSVFPLASLVPPERNLDIFWENFTKNILKEAGFTEVYNYSFVSEKDASLFALAGPELVEVENPLSLEQKYLRPSLIPGLLKNVRKNQKNFVKIKIFELGRIFRQEKAKPREKRMLTAAVFGEDFYQLKGTVDALLNKMGISDIWYDDYKPTPEQSRLSLWQHKKCAEIKIGGDEVGFLGGVSSKIIKESGLAEPLVIFDMDFEKLAKLASEEHEFRPIPRYPAAVRDLAILVPLGTKVVEVLNVIEAAGGKLVRDTDLFDIYEGEELPEGKKNLAFRIIYQAEDRTLSAKEIDGIHNKIIKALEQEPEWQVRK